MALPAEMSVVLYLKRVEVQMSLSLLTLTCMSLFSRAEPQPDPLGTLKFESLIFWQNAVSTSALLRLMLSMFRFLSGMSCVISVMSFVFCAR